MHAAQCRWLQTQLLQLARPGCMCECSQAEVLCRHSVQRFSQGNLLKKTIFELIAAELLKAAAVPESLQVGCLCHSCGAVCRATSPLQLPRNCCTVGPASSVSFPLLVLPLPGPGGQRGVREQAADLSGFWAWHAPL
jgi:hypothetical protein